MSEIENSRESFNAASDANDSLEPGELKLTPPRNSPVINHDVTRDQKRSSISSLEILKNYQSDHDDQRKDNENDNSNGGGGRGGGKYYEHRRNFQNNRRSPTNNQRFYNNYNPNFRNNRGRNNRPGFNRGGRGGFMHGRNNRNFGYNRNHFQPEHQFDNQKQYYTNKSNNLLSYTKTKPTISWRINEMFQNSKKLEHNATVDNEKLTPFTKDDPEISKKDKFEKSKNGDSELSIKISTTKHKKSKNLKRQRSESETSNKNFDINDSKCSERYVKEQKSIKKEKKKKKNIKENSNENINKDEKKISKKKKNKKIKRKYSKSEESEPKTPPLLIKSTTPELTNIEKPKEPFMEINNTVKSPTTKIIKEQKLKRKISSSSNSSKKSKKHSNNKSNNNKKNKLNPQSLSFVDDLYGNDNSNDIFPLSKDEPPAISTKNEKQIKIKIENKSDSNMSDSPDTDEYQDMWEEDEELISSQISESTDSKVIETLKRPESIKKSKSMEKLTNNLMITDEQILLQNIKIEKDDNDDDNPIIPINVNQDLNNKSSKKFIEDIFSENSREAEIDNEPENEDENAEDKDIKDGLSTPIFVNPSPPSDVITNLPISTLPLTDAVTTVVIPVTDNSTKVDIFKEDNEVFEPAIDPNKKLLFGMQDIYEQFLQSVTNAGIDISSNDNNESTTPKIIKIPKEIISPLELEATASSSILTNVENLPNKPEPLLTTELVLLHNEQNKSGNTEIPKRLSSPSSSSTTSSSSSSSSTSSDTSDSSSTSTTSTTTSSTNSSDQKDKKLSDDSPEYLDLFSKEDKKKLRALQKRLETLKSWSAMDEDEQDCFQGLQKVLENEINLLKRKYINMDNIEEHNIIIPVPASISTEIEPVAHPKLEPLEEDEEINKIFDANRDTIKIKISPKITTPNKIWTLPIPQIFSIEEEIAKAKANNEAAAAELVEKNLKSNDDKGTNEKKSKSSELHSSSSSRRSTRSPVGNRSPDKNHRDSNTSTPANRRSSSRDRRSRGSPHSSDNRKSSSSNHNLKSRRRNRHTRSRSHTPVKRFRGGDSPSRKISRRRDINRSFRGGGGRGSFNRHSYSRSRSRSNSRSRFSRRRSISPYVSRRYSRSPPFRPPSPPPSHKIRHGGSRSSTHSRSRSISPQHRHIHRLSPSPWPRDENNCSQYYDAVEAYSSYSSVSPNRSTLDNRINQELNIRPIGTTIPSYQSYTQFNSYNDYMPTMQINTTTSQFNNNNNNNNNINPYAVGYQQNTNIQVNQQEYCTNPVTDDYHSSYYYNLNNNTNEYQQNPNIKPVIRQDFKDHLDNAPNINTTISDFSIAVQKGNVLEIVPASTMQHTTIPDNFTDRKIKEEYYNMENKNFGDKKKIPSWKEEVNRRNVLCAVLKLNRETDGSMKSILIDVPECSKPKEKKLVLFADGIRPGNGPNDEKSTIYKKEKKIRKSNKDKKKTVITVHDNKENENVQVQELQNVDTKIDIQLENAPPPPPPIGSPPPYLDQPILIRKNSPEQLLYFHFDPVVNSMYVSQIPNAIPPRLLNRQNQTNTTNQSPGQLPSTSSSLQSNIGNNGNGKSPSIPSSSPNISHDKSIMPKIGLPRCDKFMNSPRIIVPTAIPPPSSPSQQIQGQFPSNTIGYHQRFHNIGPPPGNLKNTSMSSCNFSMPPPSINQQFQPLCFLQSTRPPNLEQLKRATATLPFNPIVPPPLPITDNTPAFSSDSGSSSTSFFKNDNNSVIIYPSHSGNTGGQQFVRNDTKNLSNLYNITTVTSTP